MQIASSGHNLSGEGTSKPGTKAGVVPRAGERTGSLYNDGKHPEGKQRPRVET